ncbi:MAG: RnfH family protein [Methylomonas sp.]|jgi:putative ubiquitin-RnfH superfamily antitoxin RatB of RatAB toxin-antitoxin module
MAAEEFIAIEVAYATPEQQFIIALQMPVNSTAGDAIQRSGILRLCPEIDLTAQKIGLFSRICGPQQLLRAGDRVEIYRPLARNPMQARLDRLNKS